MYYLSFLQNPAFQALGFSMLHSLWQGLIVFALVHIALAFIPPADPRKRYKYQYLGLVLLFVLFVTTFFVEWMVLKEMRTTVGAAPAGTFEGRNQATDPHDGTEWKIGASFITFYRLAPLQSILPFLVVLYATGLCFYYSRMIAGLWQLRRLRRKVVLPEVWLEQLFLKLKDAVAPRKRAMLRLSKSATTILLTGFFKPVILLPLSLISRLTEEQITAMLLHELAHLKRNDYFWNIFQSVLETFLFFNPVTWQLSQSIRLEREHCCDDFVVGYTRQPNTYAYALLQLAAYKTDLMSPVIAASGPRRASLFNRIKRIVDMKYTNQRPQRMLATIGVLCLVAATTCFFTAWGQTRVKVPQSAAGSATEDSVSNSSTKAPVLYQSVPGMPSPAAGKFYLTNETPEDSSDSQSYQEAMDQAQVALKEASSMVARIPWDSIVSAISHSVSSIPWDSIQDAINNSVTQWDNEDLDSYLQKNSEEVRQALEAAREEMEAVRKKMAGARTEYQKAMSERRQIMGQQSRDSLKLRLEAFRHQRENMLQAADSVRHVALAMAANVRKTAFEANEVRKKNMNARSIDAACREMAKDGLIDPDKGYDIDFTKTRLKINGTVQPLSVFNKYKSYFPEGARISIHQDNSRSKYIIRN